MKVKDLFNALAQILNTDKNVVVEIDGELFEVTEIIDGGVYTKLQISREHL